MLDPLVVKTMYTVLVLAPVTLSSLIVDNYPRVSRVLRVFSYILIPSLFISTRLIELQDYQTILAVTTSIVAFGISLHSEGYYRVIYGLSRHTQVIIDITLASILLLFTSTLFFELLVYWLLVDIVVAFIAITMEHSPENFEASTTYISMCIAPSDLALLSTWAILANEIGVYEALMLPVNKPLSQPIELDSLTSILLLSGFSIKIGQFPLHYWPPVVYTKSPSHVSALLSGLVSKIGVYAYLLVNTLFRVESIAYYILLVQGIISTIYGSFGAVLQSNIKRILAYSSVSYGGVFTILYSIMSLIDPSLRLVIMGIVVFHAMTKTLAFLNTGLIYQLTNTYDVFKLGYLYYVSREASDSAMVVLLNLTGTPPSMGFIVKVLLITASVLIAQRSLLGLLLVTVFSLSSILSIVYGVKFMSAYISTLPKTPIRVTPIPRVEIWAENYLNILSLVAPSLYTLIYLRENTILAAITPLYVVALTTYVYIHIKTRRRVLTPEDVKYWISGVES